MSVETSRPDPAFARNETAASISWPDRLIRLAWGIVAALVLMLATLAASRLARHRFWCAQAGCEVDVELEEHGVPGFRRFIAVRRCSAFTPSTRVTCRRSCLHGGIPEEAAVAEEGPGFGRPGHSA